MKAIVSKQEFKILTIVMLVATTAMMGVDIHLASMPAIMAFMHTDTMHMHQSVSLFLLGSGLSLLFYGPFSDRFGRKPVIIAGLLLGVIASFASAFCTSISWFLVMRVLQGIGAGAGLGMARVVIADVLQGERLARVASYFALCLAASPLFAPAIGGYVQQAFGWQYNFVLLGVSILLMLLVYALFCPETNLHKNKNAATLRGVICNYTALLRCPAFIMSTLIAGSLIAATMVYATLSPFIFQNQFHLSPVVYGWVTGIVGAGLLVGKLFTPSLVVCLGGMKTIFIGLMLFAVMGLAMVLFGIMGLLSVSFIVVPVFVIQMAQSFVMPNTASLALSEHHERRGAAGALYGSFTMLTGFAASAIVGAVAGAGSVLLSASYLILGGISLLLFVGLFVKSTSGVRQQKDHRLLSGHS